MRDCLLQIGPARPTVEAENVTRACRDGVPAACVMTVSFVGSRVPGRGAHRSGRPWASRLNLFAVVIYSRAAVERHAIPLEETARRIAARHALGLALDD